MIEYLIVFEYFKNVENINLNLRHFGMGHRKEFLFKGFLSS